MKFSELTDISILRLRRHYEIEFQNCKTNWMLHTFSKYRNFKRIIFISIKT